MRQEILIGIGAFMFMLAAVFIWGNLWFHFVEKILRLGRKLFLHREKQLAWHTLPSDKEETEND